MTVPTKKPRHRKPETWRSRAGDALAFLSPRRWHFPRTPTGRFRLAMAGLAVAMLAIGALVFAPTPPVEGTSVQAPAAPTSDEAPTSESSAVLAAQSTVDTDVAPAPGMIPELAPPDGPDPDVGPYQIDPIAIRHELESHGVETSDVQLPKLTEAVNGYLARSDAADLKAWDQQITDDVKALWPDLDREHRIDVVRCTAEYVERVHARNAGLRAPPDSDDHDVTVGDRGPQPRVFHIDR